MDRDFTGVGSAGHGIVAKLAQRTTISIRLDPYVLAFSGEGGAGYQKRINAVLRSFVTQTRKARAVKKATTNKARAKSATAA